MPRNERLTVVPTIKLLPKLKFHNKVVPEIGDSTSSNSKSTSFVMPPARSSHKTNSLIMKSRDLANAESDVLSFEEFKKTEIIQSRRILRANYPYWFVDSFYDMDLTRTIRPQSLVFNQFDKNGSVNGFEEWKKVKSM